MAAISPNDIITLVVVIANQVQTKQGNNILCEELARRAQGISAVLAPVMQTVNFGGDLLQRVYDILQSSLRFIERFSKKGWLRQFMFAEKYKEEFTSLNSGLTEALSDLKFSLQVQQHVDSQKHSQVVLDSIKNVSLLVQRFENMLPEMLVSNVASVEEVLELDNNEIKSLFSREIKDSSASDELESTINNLRDFHNNDSARFRTQALPMLAKAVYRYTEAPIDASRVQVHWNKELGQGAFGLVVCGLFDNNTDVAVKTMLYNSTMDKDFFREIYLMRRLDQYPHILKIHGWLDVKHPDTMKTFRCLLTARCSKTLANAVLDLSYNPPLTTWIRLLCQVAEGMSSLALEGIYHRDLKPENVLLTESGEAMITDFGMSVTKSSILRASSLNVAAGTAGYIAPELLDDNPSISELSDVYSFGVLMTYVIHRRDVWEDARGATMSARDIYQACRTRSPLLPTLDTFPALGEDVVHLNGQCCNLLPSLRPRFGEIMCVLQRYLDTASVETVDSSEVELDDSTEDLSLQQLTFEQSIALLEHLGCKNVMQSLVIDRSLMNGELLSMLETPAELQEIGINMPTLVLKKVVKSLQEYAKTGISRAVLNGGVSASAATSAAPVSPRVSTTLTGSTKSQTPTSRLSAQSSSTSPRALDALPTVEDAITQLTDQTCSSNANVCVKSLAAIAGLCAANSENQSAFSNTIQRILGLGDVHASNLQVAQGILDVMNVMCIQDKTTQLRGINVDVCTELLYNPDICIRI